MKASAVKAEASIRHCDSISANRTKQNNKKFERRQQWNNSKQKTVKASVKRNMIKQSTAASRKENEMATNKARGSSMTTKQFDDARATTAKRRCKSDDIRIGDSKKLIKRLIITWQSLRSKYKQQLSTVCSLGIKCALSSSSVSQI